MKIKISYILSLFIFSQTLLPQNKDSLIAALKNAKQDTTRCNILNALVETEADDSIWPLYNEQLKTLCETNLKRYSASHPLHLFYTKKFADALSNRASFYQLNGDIFKALSYYNQSLNILKNINDKKRISINLIHLGSLYQHQGDTRKALNYFRKSLRSCSKFCE